MSTTTADVHKQMAIFYNLKSIFDTETLEALKSKKRLPPACIGCGRRPVSILEPATEFIVTPTWIKRSKSETQCKARIFRIQCGCLPACSLRVKFTVLQTIDISDLRAKLQDAIHVVKNDIIRTKYNTIYFDKQDQNGDDLKTKYLDLTKKYEMYSQQQQEAEATVATALHQEKQLLNKEQQNVLLEQQHSMNVYMNKTQRQHKHIHKPSISSSVKEVQQYQQERDHAKLQKKRWQLHCKQHVFSNATARVPFWR